MSKRSYEESLFHGGSPAESIDNSHNGHLPINDLLSPEPPPSASGSVKKPRNFIATVVCFLPYNAVRSIVDTSIGMRNLPPQEDQVR